VKIFWAGEFGNSLLEQMSKFFQLIFCQC